MSEEKLENVMADEKVVAPKRFKKTSRKKVCNFCVEKSEYIDYKDVAKLRRYTTEKEIDYVLDNIKKVINDIIAISPYQEELEHLKQSR